MKLREGIINMIDKTKGQERTSMSYSTPECKINLERFPFDGEITMEIFRNDTPKVVISVTTLQQANGKYLRPYFYIDADSEDELTPEQFSNLVSTVSLSKTVAAIMEEVLNTLK